MAARSTGRYWVYGSLVIGFLLFVTLFLFFKDESLNPAAKADLEFKPTYSKPEKNGYYALIGLMAESGMQPWQAGWKVKSAYDKHLKTGKHRFQFGAEKLAWFQSLTVSGLKQISCKYQEEDDCHTGLFKPGRKLQKLINDNKELLTRYEHILDYPLIEDTTLVIYPFDIRYIHYLLLAKSTLLWQKGRRGRATKLLEKSYLFWRKVLRGDVRIASKMLAVAILKTTLRYYANLFEKDTAYFRKRASHDVLIEAFNHEDFDFYVPLRSDFKDHADYFVGFGYGNPENYGFYEHVIEFIVVYFTYKENATINSIHNSNMSVVKLSRVPSQQFPAAYKQHINKKPPPDSAFDLLYNSVGKKLLAMSIRPFHIDLVEVHRLEILRRLVVLKHEILTSGISHSAINDYLKKNHPQYAQLYSGEPAEYDKDKEVLFFTMPLPNITRVQISLSGVM